jgi:hypothetical protein
MRFESGQMIAPGASLTYSGTITALGQVTIAFAFWGTILWWRGVSREVVNKCLISEFSVVQFPRKISLLFRTAQERA